MKQHVYFLLAAMMGISPMSDAQEVITTVDCDLMGLVVNIGSQPNFINLYHPGGYLTWPNSENVMEWEFTDSQGNVLHEETLMDYNFVSFDFDMPVTDTMYVSVLLTNDSAFHNGNPVACLVEDYLFWEATEIIPGFVQSSWTLGGSVGVDVSEPVEPPCNLQYDGDGDGTVTVVDVLGLLAEFGQTCAEPFSLVGRWHPEGFEGNTLYEFTETLRYTIYAEDGTFGGIEDAIPNPNPWHMEGDSVVIDLFLGNALQGLLTPSCEDQMVTMTQANGMTSTLIGEGVDPAADCD
ncbi:MAG: hypothetical protein MUP94_06230 [Flavobacteriales bacterium]|jgi:hypothetical protein|nr:hypothetical protein [Flavobacteriales bacterium]